MFNAWVLGSLTRLPSMGIMAKPLLTSLESPWFSRECLEADVDFVKKKYCANYEPNVISLGS